MDRFDSADRSGSALTTGENAGTNIETGIALRVKTKGAWNANRGPNLFQTIHFFSVLPRNDETVPRLKKQENAFK